MKKRKKIPRVIPPPPTANLNATPNEMESKPFWKQPLPQQVDDKAPNGGLPDVTNSIRMKLEDKRRKEERQLRSLQGGLGREVDDDDNGDFMSLPNGTTLGMAPPYATIASAQHLQQHPYNGSLGRTYAQPFHAHDSSGDQGET